MSEIQFTDKSEKAATFPKRLLVEEATTRGVTNLLVTPEEHPIVLDIKDAKELRDFLDTYITLNEWQER